MTGVDADRFPVCRHRRLALAPAPFGAIPRVDREVGKQRRKSLPRFGRQRKDQSGRPWLTPAEVAAGERLRAEAEIAAAGPSLTMRWDALPRSGSGGGAARVEPGDRALSASARVKAALDACGPRLRAMVEQVCIHGTSLQLAEQALCLRRRQGKTLLKQGLQALAEHYGLA